MENKKKLRIKKSNATKSKKSKKQNYSKQSFKKDDSEKKVKLSKNLILNCKKSLIAKYSELAKVSYKNEDIMPDIGDDIDLAKNALDKEILHELTDTQRNLLNLITIALEKIDRGDYGVCECCKKNISIKRIKALPWARYCIKCQTNEEHH